MDKKFLKKLVEASYTEYSLDAKKVEKIVPYLSKKELKVYIKGLKKREQEMTVQIDAALPLTEKQRESFEKHYLQKRVVFGVDSSLLLGYRVRENDIIYNINLSDTLHDIETYLTEQYD